MYLFNVNNELLKILKLLLQIIIQLKS
jgi:hypothetical protein